MDATACRWTASSAQDHCPLSRNQPLTRWVGAGAGAGQGPGAEIGTVQGSSRFVNLSNEGLITLAPPSVRLREIGEVALCTWPSTESDCCVLLGVHNPIGV